MSGTTVGSNLSIHGNNRRCALGQQQVYSAGILPQMTKNTIGSLVDISDARFRVHLDSGSDSRKFQKFDSGSDSDSSKKSTDSTPIPIPALKP